MTRGVFDPITGSYQFYTTDQVGFPPGSYRFEVTGTSFDASASVQFVMELVGTEEVKTEESGFEILPESVKKLQLETFYVDGYNDRSFSLPLLTNALEQELPMFVDLPAEVLEFARYDQALQAIFVEGASLREKHEGTYTVTVEVEYG